MRERCGAQGGLTMSDLIQEMISRRSVRKYKPDMVPKETIDKIIEAGLYAPSGMGRQPVIILAITNKEVRDRFSKLTRASWERTEQIRFTVRR